MDEQFEKVKLQHFTTYKNAIIESIKNNTNVLTDEDLCSLFKKPPLDSMDSLKVKILSLAKKNKIILNTESLSNLLDDYRDELLKAVKKIKKYRKEQLINIIENISDVDKENLIVLKLLKKDFIPINKEISIILKETLDLSSKKFLSKIDKIFKENIDKNIKQKIVDDISRFITGSYKKQLLENVDIKILIKDTTIINIVKEQTERYLFTINNSRLFKDNI